MTLPAHEFIRRFLIHVLPAGFHRIRYYGLFANGGRTRNLALARRLLDMSTPSGRRTRKYPVSSISSGPVTWRCRLAQSPKSTSRHSCGRSDFRHSGTGAWRRRMTIYHESICRQRVSPGDIPLHCWHWASAHSAFGTRSTGDPAVRRLPTARYGRRRYWSRTSDQVESEL